MSLLANVIVYGGIDYLLWIQTKSDVIHGAG
jgi:hypothetical protein